MNRRVLIISPYFPPSNAADMQRIRMSLPYFEKFGWNAEVVTVAQKHSDVMKDELLMQSIPTNIKIHDVGAFDRKWTSKLGLGSLALRSIVFYLYKVNQMLRSQKFDLIYFSTTQFPVCILGAYWKKRFKIPYVIDIQDPWHSDYYQDKPKAQRPPKYWFSYRLNKYLEPIAMRHVDGLISVSDDYIKTLKSRYPKISAVPSAVITFGAFEKDFEISGSNQHLFKSMLHQDKTNILYIGRGGHDMQQAIATVFETLRKCLEGNPELFKKLHFHFIGTSYAPAGSGIPTIIPVAKKYGLEDQVTEITDRISFYQALYTLQKADALFIPGSDDPKYSASKIYPYLLVQKPLLAIFHQYSNVIDIIDKCVTGATLIRFSDEDINSKLAKTLTHWSKGNLAPLKLTAHIKDYSAENMTLKQTELFNSVIQYT